MAVRGPKVREVLMVETAPAPGERLNTKQAATKASQTGSGIQVSILRQIITHDLRIISPVQKEWQGESNPAPRIDDILLNNFKEFSTYL